MNLKWSSDFFVAASKAGIAATGAVENMARPRSRTAPS